MRSYIEKAIENYVKPVILNYHNHYAQMEEMEEIFYERTGRVLYLIRKQEKHEIWETTPEEMVKDRMFYEFKENRLFFKNPLFLDIETPIVARALRYGATLKLEDLYTSFSKAVDMVVTSIRGQLDAEG